MTRPVVGLLVFGLAGPVTAGPFLSLHHAPAPVVVPGGTSPFYMDTVYPPESQPVEVESILAADGGTESFPVFVSVPFSADTVLEPFVGVEFKLSAIEPMNSCAAVTATVNHVTAAGGSTPLATWSVSAFTIPQSTDAGHSGFYGLGFATAVPSGATVLAGEGVSLAVSVTNTCGGPRRVWFTYDAEAALAYVRFRSSEEVEFRCKVNAAKLSGKFVAGKQQCLTKCRVAAFKSQVLPVECVAPFAGLTAACVTKIETSTSTKMARCLDCPECYLGGDCTADAIAKVGLMESIVDGLQPEIFCDDGSSGDGLTVDEFSCQYRLATALAKLEYDVLKCLTACRGYEFKLGQLAQPGGACTPPVSDPRAAACLAKAELKAAAAVDRSCLTEQPECHTRTGAQWASTIMPIPLALGEALFCSSPSAAFVD